jgi:hypothetical protein
MCAKCVQNVVWWKHPLYNQIKSTKLNLGNNYTLGERTNDGWCPVQ